MPNRYAEGTAVTPERSRDELYRTLKRYGATETLVYEGEALLRVGFAYRDRKIAVPFALPRRRDFRTAAGYDREVRRRWRVLLLLIKGRLESVAEGAEDVDEAFMPYVMLPGSGGIVADEVKPRMAEAYRTGKAPELLPALPAPPTIEAKVIELPERTAGGGR
jgi:hypothetical protein